MSEIFRCQFYDHNQDSIFGFCLNSSCKSKPQCCIQCVRTKHKDHLEDCKSFTEIQQTLDSKLVEISRIQNYVNQLMEDFKKLIDKMTKKIQKTCQKLTDLRSQIIERNYLQFIQDLKYLKSEYLLNENDIDLAFRDLNEKIEKIFVEKVDLAEISIPKIEFLSIDDWSKKQQSFSFSDDREMERGKTLFTELKHTEAILCFDNTIDLNRNNFEAYLYKGHSLLNIDKTTEALECYQQAIQLNDQIDILVEVGGQLNLLKRQNEALFFYNKVLDRDPTRKDILIIKAKILKEQRKFEEALNCCDEILILDPSEKNAKICKCNMLMDLMKFNEAMKVYDQFVDSDIELRITTLVKELISTGMQINYEGMALEEKSKHEEALKCYDQARIMSPANPEIYFQSGNALYSLNRFDEAIENYDKAIQNDPNFVKAYINKGNALTQVQKYHEAIIEQDKAIKLDPNNFTTYLNKGLTLEKLKKYKEAIQCYYLAKQNGGSVFLLDDWIQELKRLC